MKTATSPSSDWVEQNTKLPVDVKVQTGPSTQEVTDLPVGASFRSAPSLRSKRIQRAALAAAALILSGFALLFVCKGVSSNLTEAGLAHRRLAGIDDHDEELDAILNQCLELEAEHGEPPPETEWVEPAAKKARLVAFLQEAAAYHESAGLDSTVVARGSHISPSGTQAKELEWPGATPSSGLQSTDEILTHEDVSLPGLGINPDLDPNAFLEQIPLLIEEGKEDGKVSGEPHVLQGEDKDGEQQQPSTSRALAELLPSTSSPSPQQSALEKHPFYRLPAIIPGAITRQPAVVPNYTENYLGASFFKMVKKMRELFLLPVLGPKEVEELMCAAESLGCYLLTHPSAGARSIYSPSQAVRYFGQYFMMLDCLLCARQLVGPQMFSEHMWQAMTESIDTGISLLRPMKQLSPREHHNRDLVSRLIPAMKLMKAGVRPGAEDIVNTKRMLLCSKYLDIHFVEPRWDPWRQDDAQFAQIHEDSDDSEADEN